MSGERHYLTALRIAYPELAHELDQAPTFQSLPDDVRKAVSAEFGELIGHRYPEITEDTMPGELGNCMAGRVANLFDLHGPNFVVDAACASALAAIDASVAGLVNHSFDTAIAGGVDRNMGASSFVKFCKIGALSATGTRPFDAGADGFVMGEGAGVFVLKRLADAERDGDRIYAVLRGIGGASDGRGKGITAPNPVGQRLAVQRAWRNAGLSPASCGMIECHGTSTRVGDVVEVTSIGEAFSGADLAPGIGGDRLGQVEHRPPQGRRRGRRLPQGRDGDPPQGAAAQPPCRGAQPQHRLGCVPVRREHRAASVGSAHRRRPHRRRERLRVRWHQLPRRARGVRARPRAHGRAEGRGGGRRTVDVRAEPVTPHRRSIRCRRPAAPKAPLRGALVLGADDEAALAARLWEAHAEAVAGHVPAPAAPREADLRAAERVAIDYADADDLADKIEQALAAFPQPARWKALRGRGIFRGSGPAPKVAFLYTGQGSQYANMLAALRDIEPIVADDVRRGRRHHGAADRPSADVLLVRRRRPTPTPSPRPKRTCAEPRSPSPPCCRSTSPSPASSPPTASCPTS